MKVDTCTLVVVTVQESTAISEAYEWLQAEKEARKYGGVVVRLDADFGNEDVWTFWLAAASDMDKINMIEDILRKF